MLKRRPVSSLFALLITASASGVLSQQQQQPLQPSQPLGDALHLVFDMNKDQKVIIEEVISQLTMLNDIFKSQETSGDPQAQEYSRMLLGARAASRSMFDLLDSNGDKALSKKELEYTTKFEDTLKKDGGMRDLLRDVFGLIDGNGDDQLSVDELLEASQSDDAIAKVAVRFHELLPLRQNAEELEGFVRSTIESIGGKGTLDRERVVEGMKWIDDDGDGQIHRKEVAKYYKIAGKKFLDVSKTIKQMAPMMMMFMGGMQGGGMGGMQGGGMKRGGGGGGSNPPPPKGFETEL